MHVFRPVLQRFGSDIAHVLHVKAGSCGSSANQCTVHVWKWRRMLVNMKAPIVDQLVALKHQNCSFSPTNMDLMVSSNSISSYPFLYVDGPNGLTWWAFWSFRIINIIKSVHRVILFCDPLPPYQKSTLKMLISRPLLKIAMHRKRRFWNAYYGISPPPPPHFRRMLCMLADRSGRLLTTSVL